MGRKKARVIDEAIEAKNRKTETEGGVGAHVNCSYAFYEYAYVRQIGIRLLDAPVENGRHSTRRSLSAIERATWICFEQCHCTRL